jgi:hypothetical protein
MGLDFIGDVHGHSVHLINLLIKLGYKKINNTYRHSDRKVIFLGDYIDRGIQEENSILIVRNMVDSGDAQAIMGNHEYNAICFGTQDENGNYLRPHTERNFRGHSEFLSEYPLNSKKYKDAISWFKTLPLFLENNKFRAVHACWYNPSIEILKSELKNGLINDDFLFKSAEKNTKEYLSVENCLKGLEAELPNEFEWADKDGIKRKTMRLNWFKKSENKKLSNLALSIPSHVELPDCEIENDVFFYKDPKNLFIGHYWLRGEPARQSKHIACLDYSVAKKGKLVAYRFDDEDEILNEKFIY